MITNWAIAGHSPEIWVRGGGWGGVCGPPLETLALHTYIHINPSSWETIQDIKKQSAPKKKRDKKENLTNSQTENRLTRKYQYQNYIIYNITSQYSIMIGDVFLWKVATDSASTADMGRLFQRGIIRGKRRTCMQVWSKICHDFRQKYVIFPSLFQSWPKIPYPISDIWKLF